MLALVLGNATICAVAALASVACALLLATPSPALWAVSNWLTLSCGWLVRAPVAPAARHAALSRRGERPVCPLAR